ncbi:uncharacterized protein PAC_06177 [Phialocephala subalpina]|uniref:Thioesterase domain-containing protein n=1 Tax=Phialocephala subalpina TaxID=576137 RepID=A0A1L7WU43_9HELO|nr:uncharacterized protein PAC_06177 [Phialocephala subalpina]
MPEHWEDFSAPWCQRILTNPQAYIPKSPDRSPPPPWDKLCSNRIISLSLNTPRAIRAFQPTMSPISESDKKIGIVSSFPKQTLNLISVGDGMDGWNGVLAGGAVSLMLDITTGIMAMEVLEQESLAWTLELITRFKKAVKTPNVLLVRSWLGSREEGGRKIVIKARLEDGEGTVFADADALYIGQKEKRMDEDVTGKKEKANL